MADAEEEDRAARKAADAPAGKGGSRARHHLSSAAPAAPRAHPHRNELLAALELLKERRAVTQEEEDQVLQAYDGGDPGLRNLLEDLVERLEEANFGKVVIGIKERAQHELRRALAPDAALAPQEEVRLEEVAEAGRTVIGEVGDEVKERGEELVQDLVQKGRQALLQDETRDMERVFFKWAMETLAKIEQLAVRAMVGTGAVLLVVAVLWAAHQVEFMQDLVRFLTIFLLVLVGILLIVWSSKFSEWATESRRDLQGFVDTGPSRRLHHILGKQQGTDASTRGAGSVPAEAAPGSPDPPTHK